MMGQPDCLPVWSRTSYPPGRVFTDKQAVTRTPHIFLACWGVLDGLQGNAWREAQFNTRHNATTKWKRRAAVLNWMTVESLLEPTGWKKHCHILPSVLYMPSKRSFVDKCCVELFKNQTSNKMQQLEAKQTPPTAHCFESAVMEYHDTMSIRDTANTSQRKWHFPPGRLWWKRYSLSPLPPPTAPSNLLVT